MSHNIFCSNIVLTDGIRPQAKSSLKITENFVDGYHYVTKQTLNLLETILDESGYTDMWQNDKSIEALVD